MLTIANRYGEQGDARTTTLTNVHAKTLTMNEYRWIKKKEIDGNG